MFSYVFVLKVVLARFSDRCKVMSDSFVPRYVPRLCANELVLKRFVSEADFFELCNLLVCFLHGGTLRASEIPPNDFIAIPPAAWPVETPFILGFSSG